MIETAFNGASMFNSDISKWVVTRVGGDAMFYSTLESMSIHVLFFFL